jgi:hypothetical protein
MDKTDAKLRIVWLRQSPAPTGPFFLRRNRINGNDNDVPQFHDDKEKKAWPLEGSTDSQAPADPFSDWS